MKSFLVLHLFGALIAGMAYGADDIGLASSATNQFAVDLHRQLATGDRNLCISPYSIETALAMTFAGADGETRDQMSRVLHLPKDGDAANASFSSLLRSLEDMTRKTAEIAAESKKLGGPSEPIALAIANRLFAQSGYDFRSSFMALTKKFYSAPFEALEFTKNADEARQHINKWVADQTRDRIRDLIPANGVNEMTRLVLANAIYFKAPWASEFFDAYTRPKPFHVGGGGATVDVAMMQRLSEFGYAKRDGFTAVALPYSGGELQFLVLLPDEVNGLQTLEKGLSAEMLAQCAKLERHDVDLSMPKFKFEPPTIALAGSLKTLGMNSAFDQPRGSANFDRIAPRKPNDYLYISDVFHKTFIAVDEKGTEAAAATAVTMMAATAMAPKPTPPPIVVTIDRPFLYAIQHVPSGVCLFLGRVTDPR
jgi:serine protease inhibitor